MPSQPSRQRSLGDLVAWLHAAPPGTLLEAAAIAKEIANASAPLSTSVVEPVPPSWRERLWTAAADTRIGVAELCEALGRPRSWVWRHTGPKAPSARIPHRKLEGELVFVVGELRSWVIQNEQVVMIGGRCGVVSRPRIATGMGK